MFEFILTTIGAFTFIDCILSISKYPRYSAEQLSKIFVGTNKDLMDELESCKGNLERTTKFLIKIEDSIISTFERLSTLVENATKENPIEVSSILFDQLNNLTDIYQQDYENSLTGNSFYSKERVNGILSQITIIRKKITKSIKSEKVKIINQ